MVTLCGSMRFLAEILDVAAEQTADGAIVLAPFAVVPAAAQSGEVKARLDALHRVKIDRADRVIVVSDATGYYGTSTAAEIAYAAARGVPVEFRRVTRPDRVEHVAHAIHREVCPDCWGWPDCPSPTEWDRYLSAARAVVALGSTPAPCGGVL